MPDKYRPFGKIDLLMGTDYSVLLPRVEKTVDLQLMKSHEKSIWLLCARASR